MPCSDSSSSIVLRLDKNECFISFEFAKITCGKEISAQTGFNDYCRGKNLKEIIDVPFKKAVDDLKINEEEDQFVLYLEWDALRSCATQYLGIDDEDIDHERCHITSINHNEEGEIEVALVILPPKDMPNILSCGINHKEE